MYLPDDASGLDVGDGAAATEGVAVLALWDRRVRLVERRGACPGQSPVPVPVPVITVGGVR